MKNVLCALMEPNDQLLNHIYTFGRSEKWQIELCGRKIPYHWSGDGIISDYLEPEDFRPVRNFSKTSVVSRLLPAKGNIRTVRPDTDLIAEQITSYFADKGFTRLASFTHQMFMEDLDGKPRHVLEALRKSVEKRGMQCFICVYGKTQENYEIKRKVLRNFFSSIERPFAVFIPNSLDLALCYRVLFELNIHIPEEAAVMCNNDNWRITENAIIPTTYIGGEWQELAICLTNLLKRMMAGEILPEKPVYVTPAGIVSRHSTDTLAVSDIRLAKAVSFYLQNYMKMIGVEDAADAAGISRPLLGRLFQERFGKTPKRFLQELRYNQMRHLLDTTDLSLSEIARQTGYGSDMALSLAFKREFRVTPGEFRSSRHKGH